MTFWRDGEQQPDDPIPTMPRTPKAQPEPPMPINRSRPDISRQPWPSSGDVHDPRHKASSDGVSVWVGVIIFVVVALILLAIVYVVTRWSM
jgi:hypothetical protein